MVDSYFLPPRHEALEVLFYWNIGVMEYWAVISGTIICQNSIVPSFHSL